MSPEAVPNPVALEPTPNTASGTPPPVVSHQALIGSEDKDAHSDQICNPNNSEGETLESHEVIELQAFSERKAWIEEKIKVSIRVMNYACRIMAVVLREPSAHRGLCRSRLSTSLGRAYPRPTHPRATARMARRTRQNREGNRNI